MKNEIETKTKTRTNNAPATNPHTSIDEIEAVLILKATKHPEAKKMNEKEIAIEAAVETLRAQTAQMQVLTDAYADMGHAAAELVRKAAAPVPPAASAPWNVPPPVTTHLRRFAKALADKVNAIVTQLTEEQRLRLGAIVPAFTGAVVANEPDVVAMVVRWLDLPPDEIAHDLTSNIDEIERRFAA